MATGRKTGGRKKGVPNRITIEVAEQLRALGCDPITGIAKMAMDENNSPELRGRLYMELAQYVAPKRRTVEHLAQLALTHEQWLERLPNR